MTSRKNVLVTGGAGYVGSHTCKALYKSGFQPIVFDNLEHGYKWAVKWGPLVTGDVQDTKLLLEVMKSSKPAAVLHFAANIEVRESVKDPLKFYKNNVGGTLSLLRAMNETGMDKFIFSSTCAIYGMVDAETLTESLPHKPVSPYGQTKSIVEHMLSDLSRHRKLHYVALRYFNAAGADPDGELGEAHNPETHLIPVSIAAAERGSPLAVYGTDFPTPDGTAIRDYTHVCDLAKAHVLALEHLLKGGKSEALNVGSGKGNSVLEVVEGLRRIGINVNTQNTGRRDGDPARLVADVTKAKEVLGWQTEMSDLSTILSTAAAWHKKHRSIAA